MSQGEAQPPPGIWNVPYGRNPTFTGRADDLDRLRQNFVRRDGPRNAVQAIHGLAGMGKTALVTEYAHRFISEYGVVWWLRAGEPTTLAADFADLAIALRLPGSVEPGQRAAVEAVKQWLGRSDRWLLIFNEAREPGDVEGYLPKIVRGHVLITSRNHGWGSLALPLQLRPLKPSEGVELLLARSGIREGEQAAARELVQELGALPLALAQAGAYIEEAGTSIRDYLVRFRERRADLMRRGAAGTDVATVATAWDIAFREAKERSPAAVDLLGLCAFLAPDDIPVEALRRGHPGFSEVLTAAVSDDFAFDATVSALRRYSLVERHEDALSVHPLVQAAVRDRLGEEERRTWAEIAVALASDLFPDAPGDPTQRGACRRWLPHARAALAHARAAAAAPSEAAERLLRHAAHYQHIIGFDASARDMLDQALKMAEALHGPDHAHVAMALTGLGLAQMATGNVDGALRHARRALRIDEKNLGPDSPIVATDLINLAAVLKEGKAYDEARRLVERALRIDQKLGPDNAAAVARDENNLGAILRDLEDREGARRCFERAIALDEQRDADDLPLHLNNLGLLLREMGQLDEAERLTSRALEIGVHRYGPDDPNVATFHSNRASVLQEMGLRKGDKDLLRDAQVHLERALSIGEQTYGSDHYVVAIRCNNLGLLLKDLGDVEGARKRLDQAVAIAKRALGPDHPRVRKLENNRAIVFGHRKPTPPPR